MAPLKREPPAYPQTDGSRACQNKLFCLLGRDWCIGINLRVVGLTRLRGVRDHTGSSVVINVLAGTDP
jgi:hypothetical protein